MGSARRSRARLSLQARRAIGALMVLAVILPLYRLLSGPETGFAGAQTVETAGRYYLATWRGSVLVIVAALVLAVVFRRQLQRLPAACAALIMRPRAVAFATGLAFLSAIVTLLFSLAVLHGKPVLNDAMAQLIHARYLATGKLAAPTLVLPEFWNMQFMLNTQQGWVSQYPPVHALLLATGLALGAAWAVGPVLMAVTAFFTCLMAERLFPQWRAVARLGALLVAVSPFLIGLAGSFMNHVTAAAFAVMAAYCALRATDDSWGWAVGAGAAIGAMLATRPLSAVLIGAVVTLGIWGWLPGRATRTPKDVAVRLGAAAAGALPFAVALAVYNAHFFESPLRFGYLAAAGPSHGLGFHVDPWGNLYGPMQALGYTSADLLALGRDLLGTPIPAVAIVGLLLVLAPRLDGGERVLAAWALLPVLGNAVYWHHDYVLGPRMLGEAAPAWCLLSVLAAVALLKHVPSQRHKAGAYSHRALLGVFVLALVVGLAYQGPRRLLGLAGREPEPVIDPPGTPQPAVVFVHEAWSDRLGSRLAARGLRLDSVRTVLGRYPPCQIQASLDGSRIPSDATCRREALSDRYGVLGIPSLVWQGDLPGLAAAGPMWVRDFGPEHNARLLEQYPERVPLVLLPPIGVGGWSVVRFDEGMAVLWGGGQAGQ